jgi:hypothetical protein
MFGIKFSVMATDFERLRTEYAAKIKADEYSGICHGALVLMRQLKTDKFLS